MRTFLMVGTEGRKGKEKKADVMTGRGVRVVGGEGGGTVEQSNFVRRAGNLNPGAKNESY